MATGKDVSKTVVGVTVKTMCFNRDGRLLVVATGSLDGDEGELRVIEAATGKEVGRTAFGDAAKVVSFSPDGRWLE